MHHTKTLQRLVRLFLTAILLAPAATPAATPGTGLVLAVQPIMPESQTLQAYQPLADYLQRITGEPVRLVTSPNFLVYWELMKRDKWDMVLDAAHFTDYRNDKTGYTVLAKLPDTVSYTLAAYPDLMILEVDELIGKRIATLPSPGLGAVRLQEIFPNPMRQPQLIQAEDADDAAKKVLSGKADAAMIPTRMLSLYPSLVPVVTTQPVPAPAISVSPAISPEIRAKIRQAMVGAIDTTQGKAMLKAVNLPAFEAADNRLYAGQEILLMNTWGY
jgi:ABC-type phosphate/phosphonate transport system substrate-binding protein